MINLTKVRDMNKQETQRYEDCIHCAKAFVVQARAFRTRVGCHDGFNIKLLNWAANQRAEAISIKRGAQQDLFN